MDIESAIREIESGIREAVAEERKGVKEGLLDALFRYDKLVSENPTMSALERRHISRRIADDLLASPDEPETEN